MTDLATGTPELQMILPAHNEGSSITDTLREWFDELSAKVSMQFVICEDGSIDDTKEILTGLSDEMPMILDMTDERRGYGTAVITALGITTAPWVLTMDSDGQYDPRDFWEFWEKRDTADVIIGWRVDRQSPFFRKVMSGSFRILHRLLFHLRLHDPSCAFLLIRQEVLEKLLPDLGLLSEGFWWEFTARVAAGGFRLEEVPVRHRSRVSGSTVVFHPSKIPGIALRNGTGLLRVWRQTRRSRS